MLRRALKLERDLPSALLAQGQLAELEGQVDVALARYTRVTQVAPSDPEGFYRLGRMLSGGAETRADADRALRKAERLDPEGAWGFRAKKLLQR